VDSTRRMIATLPSLENLSIALWTGQLFNFPQQSWQIIRLGNAQIYSWSRYRGVESERIRDKTSKNCVDD